MILQYALTLSTKLLHVILLKLIVRPLHVCRSETFQQNQVFRNHCPPIIQQHVYHQKILNKLRVNLTKLICQFLIMSAWVPRVWLGLSLENRGAMDRRGLPINTTWGIMISYCWHDSLFLVTPLHHVVDVSKSWVRFRTSNYWKSLPIFEIFMLSLLESMILLNKRLNTIFKSLPMS
jgi:hypothetical protein